MRRLAVSNNSLKNGISLYKLKQDELYIYGCISSISRYISPIPFEGINTALFIFNFSFKRKKIITIYILL